MPAPWRRYLGRYLDALAFGISFFLLMGFLTAFLSPAFFDHFWGEGGLGNNIIVSSVLTLFVNIFFSGIFIGLTGTTLGKWIFGTRITQPNGKPIGIKAALAREFDVFVRGLGLGIPFVVLITCLTSYSTLTANKICSWDDRKPWVVTHRELDAKQVFMGIAGFIALVLLYGFSAMPSRM
jgi:uncharacterized RDD family membrane protein YckC